MMHAWLKQYLRSLRATFHIQRIGGVDNYNHATMGGYHAVVYCQHVDKDNNPSGEEVVVGIFVNKPSKLVRLSKKNKQKLCNLLLDFQLAWNGTMVVIYPRGRPTYLRRQYTLPSLILKDHHALY